MSEGKQIEYYSRIESKSVEWLWYPYIPYGKITIIQGDPASGKTSFALYLAMLLSRGLPMPLSDKPVEMQNIIYQNREDGAADTIKPRLERYGADCDRVCFILEDDTPLSLADSRLEKAIIEANARVLILDPIQAYMGDGDMVRANDIRPLMTNLCKVAERTNCAIILIGHLNKKDGGKDIYRTLGSIDIVAAARSVLMVRKSDDDNDDDFRQVVQVKSNLAPNGKNLQFSLKSGKLTDWQYVEGQENSEVSVLHKCEEILKEHIGEQGVRCTEVFDYMDKQGFSKRTVVRAKASLGIRSKKQGQYWIWHLE